MLFLSYGVGGFCSQDTINMGDINALHSQFKNWLSFIKNSLRSFTFYSKKKNMKDKNDVLYKLEMLKKLIIVIGDYSERMEELKL